MTALFTVALAIPVLLLMGLFAWLVTFPLMGRSYDAAIMATGQIGSASGGS